MGFLPSDCSQFVWLFEPIEPPPRQTGICRIGALTRQHPPSSTCDDGPVYAGTFPLSSLDEQPMKAPQITGSIGMLPVAWVPDQCYPGHSNRQLVRRMVQSLSTNGTFTSKLFLQICSGGATDPRL
eukprot:GHVU01176437.1.p1 GENE.GHVU01176437.1~~GHVU01176437.1.p1  ORF type:complete len:126 (-),score=1.63 GHVU01176437.1:55-432(-)